MVPSGEGHNTTHEVLLAKKRVESKIKSLDQTTNLWCGRKARRNV